MRKKRLLLSFLLSLFSVANSYFSNQSTKPPNISDRLRSRLTQSQFPVMEAVDDSPSDVATDLSSKTVYGIRHARSVANDFMHQEGNYWGDATFRDDPSLVDAVLSETGKQQVEVLSKKLLSEDGDNSWLLEVELVVVSPLTRCLMTWESGCKEALEAAFRKDGKALPTVYALPLARERVYTCSDTGRPIAELEKDFPDVDWSLCERDAVWWYTGNGAGEEDEWRPYGQGQWYAVPGEPLRLFDKRMTELEDWIRKRPERTILLVAHWGVLGRFTGKPLENCEICQIKLPSIT